MIQPIETLLGNGTGQKIEDAVDRRGLRFDSKIVHQSSIPEQAMNPVLQRIKKLSRIVNLEQTLSGEPHWGW